MKKIHFLIFLFLNILNSKAQVIDSVVVKVNSGHIGNEPHTIRYVYADSLSAGRIIYQSGNELEYSYWPVRYVQFTYDLMGRINSETCPNLSSPQVRRLHVYNTVADSILRQNYSGGNWTDDSLDIKWHSIIGLDTAIFSYVKRTAGWQTSFRYDQHFDLNGNMDLQIKQSWDTVNLSWQNVQQILLSGDSITIWQNWDGNTWVNYRKYENLYSGRSDAFWYSSSLMWDTINSSTYTYNTNGQLIREVTDNHPGSSTTYFHYDINGNLILEDNTTIFHSGTLSYGQNNYYRYSYPSSNSLWVISSDYSVCSAETNQMSPLILGGTAPYSYAWTPATDLSNISIVDPYYNPSADITYTLTVTDVLNTTASHSVGVRVQPSVDIHLSVIALDTSSQCSSAILEATSSDQPYLYWYRNGVLLQETSTQHTIRENGTYTVIAGNMGMCRDTVSLVVNYLPHPSSPVTIAPDTCNLMLVVDCPTCNSYQWYKSGSLIPGAIYDTLQAKSDGNYSVQVVDDNQCLNSTPNIYFFPFSVYRSLHGNNSCYENCRGLLTTFGTSGTGPYTYLWSTGDTINWLDSLCNGVYQLSITDAKGCVVNFSDTITSPATPVASTNILYSAVLPDSCSGAIQVIPYGEYENRSYQVTVSTAGTNYGYARDTLLFSHLCTGWNTILINNSNCILTDSVFVGLTPGCTVSSAGFDPDCFGSCNGMLSMSSIGTPPYQYHWNTGDSAQSLFNLCSGIYSVIMTDSLGCRDTAIYVMNDPSLLVLNTTIGHTGCVGCLDGQIVIDVQGGVLPYALSITPQSGVINGDTIQNLPAGIYSVCITDVNGCMTCVSDTLLDDPTGLIAISSSATFNAFPNPARNAFYLQWNLGKNQDIIDVTDVTGRILQNIPLIAHTGIVEVSRLKAGVYFCSLRRTGEKIRVVITGD